MANKLNWKEIAGITGDVLKELISLPGNIAKDVFEGLKANKSKAAELVSASVTERHNIIKGISPNVNIARDIPRVERPGAPTASAGDSTFAGLAPSEIIEGQVAPGGNIENITFAGEPEISFAEKQATFATSTSSSEQRDAWIKNKTAKRDDKLVGLFGSIQEDELFSLPDKELSAMVESMTGKKVTEIFELRDTALDLLQEAKQLSQRSR